MWTAKEIKSLRQHLNLTQAEFADILNTNRRTVLRWENDTKPSGKAVVELNRLWEAIPLAVRHAIKPVWYYPTNDFGDCRWVKVAKRYPNGGWTTWNWNLVDKVTNFHDANNHTQVFQTIEHFFEKDKEGKQISNLFFDWDTNGKSEEEWKRNFTRCKLSVELAIEFFFDLGLDEHEIRVWFTGGRGFHLGIPYQCLGLQPQPHFNLIMKALAFDVNEYILDQAGDKALEVDFTLYSNPRMFRLPNCRYPKGTKKNYPPFDTFKIEITHKELNEIETIQEFWELARTPRPPLYEEKIFSTYGVKDDEWYEAENWEKEIVAEHEEREKIVEQNVGIYAKVIKEMKGVPKCIADLRQNGITVPPLNFGILLDATFCFNAGITQGATVEIVDAWVQAVDDNMTSNARGKVRRGHVKSVVKSVYKNKKKYESQFYCGTAHNLQLACDRHKCPLHNKYDLRKHGKNIRKVKNIQFPDDETIYTDTVDEARKVIVDETTTAFENETDLILTLPGGVGKTTTGIITLEDIANRLLYAGPRHDNNDHVIEEIAKKHEWIRILPRRPLEPKPKDKALVEKWKATALCPLFELAGKLGKFRYDVGRILCAETTDAFENPNWCGIPKGVCEWWQQFATKNSATLTHQYLFFQTIMDLLIGKGKKTPIIFDEPQNDTFVETVIISPEDITKTIKKMPHACIRRLLQIIRKAVEDTETNLFGNATMEAVINACNGNLEDYNGSFSDLLYHVREVAMRPNSIDIDSGMVVGETKSGKAYLYKIDGRKIVMPKDFEVFIKSYKTLFRVPHKFAIDNNLLEYAIDDETDIEDVPDQKGLILQFTKDLVKMLLNEYEHYQKDEPYNSGLAIKNTDKGPSFVLKIRKHLASMNTPLITLDAAGNPELIKLLLEREHEVKECNISVKMDCNIIQILDGGYGIQTLYDKKKQKTKSSFDRLIKVVKNIVKIHDPSDIFICTWNEIEKEILQMQENGELPKEIAVNHYWNIRGSNEHKDRKVTIILGTPCMKPDEFYAMAQVLFYDDGFVTDEVILKWIEYYYKNKDGDGWAINIRRYKDPRMEMLRKATQEMEIYHAAHRTRPILSKGQTIYLLTNLPIRELPPTDMYTIDELLIVTDPAFLQFEKKVLEFVNTHGGIWLEHAQTIAGDVELWHLRDWLEFSLERNGINKQQTVTVDGNNWVTVFHKDEIDPERIKSAYNHLVVMKLLEAGKVKELRESLGLTQNEFAEKLGYNPRHIRRIESGDIALSKKMIDKISQKCPLLP